MDLGFFGQARSPILAPTPRLVAVGHSLGFAWLLRQAHQADTPLGHLLATRTMGLIGINAFPRFAAGTDDWPEGTPRRILERMIRRTREDPLGVLSEFRQRAGATTAIPAALTRRVDPEALVMGLTWLLEWDLRPALERWGDRLLVLAAADDPIVPITLTDAGFAHLPDTARMLSPCGGHLLPLQRPEWCAAAIAAFVSTRLLPP
jgi:pimeloyl-ACP methyl ester carboxylesterase